MAGGVDDEVAEGVVAIGIAADVDVGVGASGTTDPLQLPSITIAATTTKTTRERVMHPAWVSPTRRVRPNVPGLLPTGTAPLPSRAYL